MYVKNNTSSYAALLTTARLTAYVAKVFAMSLNLLEVNQDVVCDAIKFLILNTQQPDGLFIEIGSVYDQGMIVSDVIQATMIPKSNPRRSRKAA